jgi:hypothetical protein
MKKLPSHKFYSIHNMSGGDTLTLTTKFVEYFAISVIIWVLMKAIQKGCAEFYYLFTEKYKNSLF